MAIELQPFFSAQKVPLSLDLWDLFIKAEKTKMNSKIVPEDDKGYKKLTPSWYCSESVLVYFALNGWRRRSQPKSKAEQMRKGLLLSGGAVSPGAHLI